MDTFVRFIRLRCPIIWKLIDSLNSSLVLLLFGKKRISISNNVITKMHDHGYSCKELRHEDLSSVSSLLADLTEEDKRFFSPFPFDVDSLEKVIRNKSIILWGVMNNEELYGLFFLRLFINNSAYLGLCVNRKCRGKGCGRSMIHSMATSCEKTGVSLFSSVSKENLQSLKAHIENDFAVISELKNNNCLLKYQYKLSRSFNL